MNEPVIKVVLNDRKLVNFPNCAYIIGKYNGVLSIFDNSTGKSIISYKNWEWVYTEGEDEGDDEKRVELRERLNEDKKRYEAYKTW